MKYKKFILILAAFIFSFIYVIHPTMLEKMEEEIPIEDEVIRFHVRANSDTDEDQELKLKVRDKLLEEVGYKFDDSTSLEESRAIIRDNLLKIEEVSEEVIRENGFDYDVDVFFGMDYFPVRKYGNMVFPQGEYETLIVSIGQGRGQNWWCVMFPPLCFVDITHSVAFNIEDDETLDNYVIDEEQPIKPKSLIIDFIKSKIND